MRKALTITLVAALALFAGSAAYANYCARDVVPASTILVPYVVVAMNGDYEVNDQGYTTFLTLTNVSEDAQIIHITVWNAVSFASLDFNEVLTGYDVWMINFRDMIAGTWSAFDTYIKEGDDDREPFEWGPDGRTAYGDGAFLDTPEDTLKYSDDDEFGDCYVPYGDWDAGDLDGAIDDLRDPIFTRDHAGCANASVRTDFNNDWLHNITDNWGSDLWFYVTVDLVDECNLDFPDTPGFFESYYKTANVLIGDVIYVSKGDKASEAINAVHIESHYPYSTSPGYNDPEVNFYEEIESPQGTSPLEPLATGFAFNFYNNPDEEISTQVLVWKNYSDFDGDDDVDDCGYYMYYVWDQDEHTTSRSGECRISPCDPNDIDPNEFPFETQAVPVTEANFDLVGEDDWWTGWMLLLFQPAYYNAPGYEDPTGDGYKNYLMAWVGVRYEYADYTAAIEAATMANTHCFTRQVAPLFGVDYPYMFSQPTE